MDVLFNVEHHLPFAMDVCADINGVQFTRDAISGHLSVDSNCWLLIAIQQRHFHISHLFVIILIIILRFLIFVCVYVLCIWNSPKIVDWRVSLSNVCSRPLSHTHTIANSFAFAVSRSEISVSSFGSPPRKKYGNNEIKLEHKPAIKQEKQKEKHDNLIYEFKSRV